MENMEATDQLRGCEVEKLRFSISHLPIFWPFSLTSVRICGKITSKSLNQRNYPFLKQIQRLATMAAPVLE